jgi:hypothetical protein
VKRTAAIALVLLVAAASVDAQDTLHLALLLDTSGSIRKADQAERNRLAEQIARSLPPGGDVAVYRFDDQPKLIVPRTGNADEVAQATASLGGEGRYTALNDAIFDAARYLGAGPAGRRAILVVTDGLDENSALVAEDGINEARERRIPIFSIGVGNVQERYLRRIAKLSGGEYFPPRTDAAAVAARVAELTPVSAPEARREAAPAAAAPSAPAGAGQSTASATRPNPAASAPTASSTWPILAGVAFAVVIALSALGFVLMRRSDAAGPASLASAEPAPARDAGQAVTDEPDDVTLVARMQDLHAEGSTLVLTLKPLLHVTKGPNFGKFYEVHVDSATSIGRAKGNDIVVDDRAISSQHCRIRPLGGVYELIDLKSTNGTFVNERKVARTNLSAGDTIKLGETAMQFRMDHMKSA